MHGKKFHNTGYLDKTIYIYSKQIFLSKEELVNDILAHARLIQEGGQIPINIFFENMRLNPIY